MSFTHWLSERLRPAPRPTPQRRARPAERAFRPRVESLEERWVPSTMAVNRSDDLADVRGTLRWAVANAQSGDTILLTGAVAKTGVTLTQGELLLTQQNLTITSPAAPHPVTISGNNQSRVFEVAGGASVTLSNVTVTAGNGLAGIPARPHEGRAGGILVDENSTLTITGSTVSGNSAPVLGGGIANYGTLTVNNSTVSDNHALGTYGGGIAVFSGAPFSAPFSATLTVSNSLVSDNTAYQNGGGIASVSSTVTLNTCNVTGNSTHLYDGGGLNNHGGTMTVNHSVVANNTANSSGGGMANTGTLTVGGGSILTLNHAVFGGGITNGGTLTVSGSSLCGNSATSDYGQGGGIFNFGTTTISSGSTLSGNTAMNGGGGIISYGTLTISGSTLSGNTATYDGGGISNFGTVTVQGFSSIIGNLAPAGFGADVLNLGVLYLDSSSMIGILDGNPAVPI